MTEYSLRLSGIIDGTSSFINPTETYPDYKSWQDMIEVANGVFNQLNEDSIIRIHKMTGKCKNEYLLDSKITSYGGKRACVVMLLRFFLNSDSGTVGRTYLPLHDIEAAKVQFVGLSKVKIISVITNDQLKEHLERLKNGIPDEMLNSAKFL
jgi:hypothetical protein